MQPTLPPERRSSFTLSYLIQAVALAVLAIVTALGALVLANQASRQVQAYSALAGELVYALAFFLVFTVTMVLTSVLAILSVTDRTLNMPRLLSASSLILFVPGVAFILALLFGRGIKDFTVQPSLLGGAVDTFLVVVVLGECIAALLWVEGRANRQDRLAWQLTQLVRRDMSRLVEQQGALSEGEVRGIITEGLAYIGLSWDGERVAVFAREQMLEMTALPEMSRRASLVFGDGGEWQILAGVPQVQRAQLRPAEEVILEGQIRGR